MPTSPLITVAEGSAAPGIDKSGKIVVLKKSTLEDFRKVSDNWSQILRGVGGLTRSLFVHASLKYSGEGQIQLVFSDMMQRCRGLINCSSFTTL